MDLHCKLSLPDGEESLVTTASEEDFVAALHRLAGRWAEQAGEPENVDMEVRYHDRWWSLTDSLPAFGVWLIESNKATPGEIRAFLQHPLQRPDLVYEAARQLYRLIDAADPT